MADLVNTGNKNTLLDNNLVVSSESVPATRVLVADTVNNRVGINKANPAVELDIVGVTAISSGLTVQTNKLIVDSSGRVGINLTPTTNTFEVSGNTNIVGSLFVSGTTFTANIAALDVLDANITINKGGTDATSSGAGITIQRTTLNALLTWNNTKLNFEAGASGSQTSLIRAAGNSDGTTISVGTSDANTLTLKANNVNALQIASTGDVTILNDLSLTGASSDILVQGISVRTGSLPPGTVIAFMPGYYGNATNGTFTPTLGGNTVSAVNAWLLANGYSQWAVCDGSPYNIASSAIFNSGLGPSRFTAFLSPTLTNERFLAGSTFTGVSAGTNTFTHTHSISVALASINIDHSHQTDSQAALLSETISLGPFAGSTAATDSFAFSNHGSLSHSHSIGSHTHGDNNFYMNLIAGVSSVYMQEDTSQVFASTAALQITTGSRSSSPSSVTGTPVNAGLGTSGAATGTTGSTSPPTTPHTHTYPHSHDITHTHTLPGAAHNHSVTPHSHPAALTSFSTAIFSHNHTGTTDNNAVTDNRPLYLTCFYIVKLQ